ncbi:hypothetical protein M4Z59_21410, partial [Escherichia coli]|nr:hypothetical protein [Escherichia coli]
EVSISPLFRWPNSVNHFMKASIIFAVPCIIWQKKSKKTGCVPTAAMKFLNVLLQGVLVTLTSEA